MVGPEAGTGRKWQGLGPALSIASTDTALKSAKSREIPRKFELIAVQGHPRSSTLVPIESAYATSYYSLIVSLDVSRTVSEILTHKARRALTRDRPHCPLTSRF